MSGVGYRVAGKYDVVRNRAGGTWGDRVHLCPVHGQAYSPATVCGIRISTDWRYVSLIDAPLCNGCEEGAS